ncbi:MAG: hypothetical protein JO071_09445 [Deltaproteobacteria bacterium]|nr:hypothetical protein [Deltaproteobacteria bacterium]
MSPSRVGGFIMHLPSFMRVFYQLMIDPRVSLIAKLVPPLGLLLLFTPPALELDFVPFIGELDWLLVIFITLKVFIWLCPSDVVREHVARVGRRA